MVIVSADIRNGGTWTMQCIEKILCGKMLFQPFEGVGTHSDSVEEPKVPDHIVEKWTDRRWWVLDLRAYDDQITDDDNEIYSMMREYVEFRTGCVGFKMTRNLPQAVYALGADNVKVIRVKRNIVDAVLSTFQHWTDPEWEANRMYGVLEYPHKGVLGWLSCEFGDDFLLAKRLLWMHKAREKTTAWLKAQPGLQWVDMSMERLSSSPIYTAPLIAELLGVDSQRVADVFWAAREPVFSYPPLRTADEIRRVEQIADQLGVDRL